MGGGGCPESSRFVFLLCSLIKPITISRNVAFVSVWVDGKSTMDVFY